MQKKNQWKITMVNVGPWATKNYPGFSTNRSLQQFCSRYHVSCFWYQPPQGTKKVLMVDEKSFKRCFKQFFSTKAFAHSSSPKTFTKKTCTPTTAARNSRTTTMRSTTKPAHTRMGTRTRTFAVQRPTTRKTVRRAA